MLTGNKGEWSEPYVLLKVLADGKLHLGDENFNQIQEIVYPVISVLRHEKNRQVSFTPKDKLIVVSNGNKVFEVPIKQFVDNARICFEKIKEGSKGKGAFAIPEIEAFLGSFSVDTLKAKSKLKNDVTIQITDPNTFLSPALGFSVKSQLGKPSTLVNASGPTNFVYRITGPGELPSTVLAEVNQTRLFSKKLELIRNAGFTIVYDSMDSPVFRSNLQTIDFYFDTIIADMLLSYYSSTNSKANSMVKYMQEITERNPRGYDLKINSSIYEMMMKRFLTDYALGMRAGEVWKRDYQATGGYLIVRRDGELICYHFYFTKKFEEYLFNNTKLDTGDPKKIGFGKIYIEEGVQKMKLNLQIRFKK